MKKILGVLALAVASSTFAQTGFPDRPVHVVVPFTPGGNTDIVTRIVAHGLSEELKQSVVVENRPGASAAIGAAYVAHAAPDGYTVLLGTAESHALNPHLQKDLPYDPLKDLTTIGIVDHFPLALVISPKVPAKNLAQFVAYAKENPGKLNFASWGNGSASQVAFELLRQVTGMDMVHVPFKGAAPAITAVAADEVQAFVVPLSVARPQASAGRVKLIAVLSEKREAVAPDVPTAKEEGVPVVVSGWHVFAVPARTPRAIVAKLNAALNAANSRPEVKESLLKVGSQPAHSTPEAAEAMVKSEYQRWGEVARKAGLKPQ